MLIDEVMHNLVRNGAVSWTKANPGLGATNNNDTGKSHKVGDWGRHWTETLILGRHALSTKPVMHYQGTVYLCY